MTDKELLELAAKAAKISYEKRYVNPEGLKFQGLLLNIGIGHQPTQWWNPLEDDGDALRLLVTLGLSLNTSVVDGKESECMGKYVPHRADHNAATRRAIVRAAAEIGKSMA